MTGAIQLVIVTPGRQLLNQRVYDVTLPGAEGEMGVLPGHAPLITELGIGQLTYRAKYEAEDLPRGTAEPVEPSHQAEDFRERVAIIRGFAEVLGDRVTVLAETAERPEEIDVERAKAALERAEKRISAGPATQDIDWDRATASLQRALTRIKVAEYAPHKPSAIVPGR
jgi:F-type H+-transporting ATPase subunit epsilon